MFKKSDPLHQLWKDRIDDFRASGKSMAQWSRENNVPSHQTHYWRNIFLDKTEPVKDSDFMEIKDAPPSQKAGIVIEINDFRVHVEPNFDEVTFLKCTKLLRGKA